MPDGPYRGRWALWNLAAVTGESYRECRTFAVPVIMLLFVLLFLLAGMRAPVPLEQSQSLAGAFLQGGAALILFAAALAYGAWSCGAGRGPGRLEGFGGLPLSGFSWFAGRFMGLALRMMGLAALLAAAGGSLLTLLLPQERFENILAAHSFLVGSSKVAIEETRLLEPGGPECRWIFPASESGKPVAGAVRLFLRSRFPRTEPLEAALPLRVRGWRGDRLILDRSLVIRNRKNLHLPLERGGSGEVTLAVQALDGRNLLEVSGAAARLVKGSAPALAAILRAGLSSLPMLLLALMTALFLSLLTRPSTAILAAAVFTLFTLYAPSLRVELEHHAPGPRAHIEGASLHEQDLAEPPIEPIHEHPKPENPSFVTAFAVKLLDLLPDPRAGGGLESLARGENPPTAGIGASWREALPYLGILLVMGSLCAGRKRW